VAKLWIDDLREPPSEDWCWAKTSATAISCLLIGPVAEISFDHDLGGDDTTMPVARLIEQRAYDGAKPPVWNIHSANPVGRRNLEAALRSAERLWGLRKST
jgi:hypothetical protein